jgi:hypothetical protein
MKRLSSLLITALALSSMSGSAPTPEVEAKSSPEGRGRPDVLPPTRKAQSLDFRRTPGSRQRRQRKLNSQRGGR